MSANTHDIKVLNGLIEALIDCADTHSQALKDAVDPAPLMWLDLRASHYLKLAEELKAEVRERGGSSEDNGSILSKAQRAFSDFKQAVLGNNDNIDGVLQHAQSHVREKFEAAANDTALSVPTRDIIRRTLERLPEAPHERETY